jgi:hypothetical protein
MLFAGSDSLGSGCEKGFSHQRLIVGARIRLVRTAGPTDHVGKRMAVDPLHCVGECIAVFDHVEDGDDVGVLQFADGQGFAAKSQPGALRQSAHMRKHL